MRRWALTAALAWGLLARPALAGEELLVGPPGAVAHQLEAQDTVESLSELYGVPPSALRQANPEAQWLEGERVWVVPSSRAVWPRHTVRSGETLWRIGKAYGISVEQLKQANAMESTTLYPGSVLTLPRAVKPAYRAVELPVVVDQGALRSAPPEDWDSGATEALPEVTEEAGSWVEVRLPDQRRAWVRRSALVVGSWQPLPLARLVEVGRQFLGVPYRFGGVDPNGWDCSGFIQEIFRLGGHRVPRLADAQYESCLKLEPEALEPGDLVFFNTDGTGVSHVGLVTEPGKFLHASSSRGVVEDRLDDPYFATRYVGGGRWMGNGPSERQAAVP